MKFSLAPSALAALLASSSAVSALSLFGSSAKNVEVTAAFPESNPFSRSSSAASHLYNARVTDLSGSRCC